MSRDCCRLLSQANSCTATLTHLAAPMAPSLHPRLPTSSSLSTWARSSPWNRVPSQPSSLLWPLRSSLKRTFSSHVVCAFSHSLLGKHAFTVLRQGDYCISYGTQHRSRIPVMCIVIFASWMWVVSDPTRAVCSLARQVFSSICYQLRRPATL